MSRTRSEIQSEIKAVADRGRRINAIQNEGGDGYDHIDNKRIESLMDELEQVIIAEWDRDTTIARRAEWNAAVKSATLPIHQSDISTKTGIVLHELKRAIKRHSL